MMYVTNGVFFKRKSININ